MHRSNPRVARCSTDDLHTHRKNSLHTVFISFGSTYKINHHGASVVRPCSIRSEPRIHFFDLQRDGRRRRPSFDHPHRKSSLGPGPSRSDAKKGREAQGVLRGGARSVLLADPSLRVGLARRMHVRNPPVPAWISCVRRRAMREVRGVSSRQKRIPRRAHAGRGRPRRRSRRRRGRGKAHVGDFVVDPRSERRSAASPARLSSRAEGAEHRPHAAILGSQEAGAATTRSS